MPDSPKHLELLSAQLEGLEAAAAGLAADSAVGVSVRRIARSLQSAAEAVGANEIAAGAVAIQRASEAQLPRSVGNFLARVEEIRSQAPAEDVRILVVEDNATVAVATAAYLEGPRRTIRIVTTAAEAEAVLAAEEFDVVLLDLILPDRDGRDLLVRMREDARTATTPVVVLSAQGGSVARAECLAVGADDFLEKPAEPKALRTAVAKLLRDGARRHDPVRDGLTGLPNRAGMTSIYPRRRDDAAKRGEPLTVAVITLDAVAAIRRGLGPDAADRFLLEVASALHELLGPGHTLARWERSELLVLLHGLGPDQARGAIEAALRRISEGEALDWLHRAGIEPVYSGLVARAEGATELRGLVASASRFRWTTAPAASGAAELTNHPLDLETKRILLVEDDQVTATLLHHRLVRDGYEVFGFPNGEDAFAWAREEDFDLAILDVKVPGMDGFELLERLRRVERHAGVPIVMLTGMGSEADVVRGLGLGADDYMLKPFSPTELLARVRRLLHARATVGEHGVATNGRTEARAP